MNERLRLAVVAGFRPKQAQQFSRSPWARLDARVQETLERHAPSERRQDIQPGGVASQEKSGAVEGAGAAQEGVERAEGYTGGAEAVKYFDERLNTPSIQSTLTAMAANSGWETRGGELLRDENHKVTGRTTWIPRESWFAELPERLNEAATVEAVRKAIAGEKLGAKERRVVGFMLDAMEREREEGAAVAPDEEAEAERAAIVDEALNALQDGDIDTLLGYDTIDADAAERFFGREAPQGDVGADVTPARGTPGGDSAPSEEAGPPGEPLLEGYSETDLKQREEARVATGRREAEETAARLTKREADEARKKFVLSGSDREADEAAARGQQSLLDEGPMYSRGPSQKEAAARGQLPLFGEEPAETKPVTPETKPAEPKTKVAEPETKATKAETRPVAKAPPAKEELKDVGEKIEGARKDLWAGRALGHQDIEGMNDRELQKFVTKEHVFPRPNYQAIADHINAEFGDRFDAAKQRFSEDVRALDMGAGSALLIKKIRDSIENPPLGASRESLEDYLTAVGMVRKVLEDLEHFVVPTGSNLVKLAFGEDIVTNERYHIWNQESPNWKYLNALGNKFARIAQVDARDWARAIIEADKTGFPKKQEVWQRDYRVFPKGDLKISKGHRFVEGKPVDGFFLSAHEGHFIKQFPTQAEAEVAKANYTPYVVMAKKSGNIVKQVDTEAEGVNFARDIYKAQHPTATREDKTPELRHIVREGQDYRGGRDVGDNEFKDAFGFRGVQFGNWTDQRDRQQSLNHAYDALMDLADALGVPPQALSLNGELGLAFGARGGGKAAAHYEPTRVVINLTKTAGAGSAAHEWAHALDDYFGRLSGDLKGKKSPFVSHGVSAKTGMRPEMVQAFKDVMSAINNRLQTNEEVITAAQADIEKSNRYVGSWLKGMREELKDAERDGSGFDALATAVQNAAGDAREERRALLDYMAKKNGRLPSARVRTGLDNNLDWRRRYYQRLNKAMSGEATPLKLPSTYAKLSAAKGPYWARAHELFARAFESFMLDKLAGQGRRSDYLVHPANQAREETDPDYPYPAGAERTNINAAFEKLVAAVAHKATEEGVALYSRATTVLQTGTPAFKRWFGDSKVVDENGEPMVVYHGTADSFSKFELDRPNRKDTGWLGEGFYFTTDADTANAYTNLKGGISPNVMPVYLRLRNPYRATIQDKERIMLAEQRGDRDAARRRTADLIQQGYDGIILSYPEGKYAKAQSEYTVFRPEQIKSAIGNRGTFDPTNPDIRYSYAGERGAKTPKHALAAAREFAEQGVPMEEIRKTTGWFKSPDSMWKFELSDKDAKLKPGWDGYGLTVGETLDHPTLFENYPSLAKIDVVFRIDFPDGVNGGYSSADNAIHLNANITPTQARSTLLHELQHAVQVIEGFARGGKPKDPYLVEAAQALGIDISTSRTMYVAYQRLLGEVEARDVQARRDLTAEELRERPPYVSQGIPESEFIVQFKGEEAAEISAGQSAASLRANLVKRLGGRAIEGLERAGFEIVETEDKLPDEVRPPTGEAVRGVYWKGKSYLVAGNIPQGAELGVLLHEVGVHAGLEGLLGKTLYSEVIQSVKTAAKIGARNPNASPFVRAVMAAQARVPNDTRAAHVTEETLAYLIEDTANRSLPLVRRVLGAIRAWLLRHGFKLQEIRPEDLVAMARASVRKLSREATVQRVPAGAPAYAAEAPTFYSEMARFVDAKGPGKNTAAQWKVLLDGWAKAGKFKGDELEWSGVREFLDLQQGPVTKDQVLGFIRENGVRVEETTLAGLSSEEIEELTALENIAASGETLSQDDRQRWVELDKKLYEEIKRPKFAQWQLPGGKNYREVLLRLPQSERGRPEPLTSLPEGYDPIIDDSKPPERRWGVTPPGQASARAMGGRHPTKEAALAEALALVNNERLSSWAAEREKGAFKSSHFDQPNILAHVRFNERVDSEGKKTLFIEEIQSDWAQKGKKEGFRTQSEAEKASKTEAAQKELDAALQANDIPRIQVADAALREAKKSASIPAAPFVGKTEAWVALALKRMIRYGSENGFDLIAWTTGEQQAERYDLSKQLDSVQVKKAASDDGYVIVGMKDGNNIFGSGTVPEGKLADYVGKELADRALTDLNAMEGEPGGKEYQGVTYSGLDLKVGGQGMLAFYDKIIPNTANALLKKLGGGRVRGVPLTIGGPEQSLRVRLPDGSLDSERFTRQSMADTKARDLGGTVEMVPDNSTGAQPGFDLTPALRESAMRGLPLFSRRSDEYARGLQAAKDALLNKRDVADAVTHSELGPITIGYGAPGTLRRDYRDGHGLSHIIARRTIEGENPAETIVRVVDVLANGKPGQRYGPKNNERTDITLGDYKAVVSLARFGKKETWLLTGFKHLPGAQRVSVNPLSYAPEVSGIPQRVVADIASRIDQELARLKPSAPGGPVKGPQGPLYSVAAPTLPRILDNGNVPPPNPFNEENRRLREEDKTTWSRAKTFWKRNFTPGGLLPAQVFEQKNVRDGELGVVEFDTENLVGQLDSAVKKVYGKRMEELTADQRGVLQQGLTGKVVESLDPRVRTVIEAMRQHVDRLSADYIAILQAQIDTMVASGDPLAEARAGLLGVITGNLGRYVHRSYRAFDDPQWFSKLPNEVIDAARAYLRGRYVEGGMTAAEADTKAERALHTIVKTGTAYDSMESFIREGKLGAKDLSILQRRKDIAPEMRALLGEYDDPRLNYAKSTSKMARLIWNTRFLDRVREIGMGTFLFEEKDAPAGATAKIAADASEVHAPLNGLWTFPEIDQAFKDAIGKETMADWYRFIVQMNGAVKYGKVILSPTTQIRNFMSAAFFALANGHFDMRHIAKSVDTLRGKSPDYARDLVRLGIMDDGAYAGEMMQLIRDSKMEEILRDKKSTPYRVWRDLNKFVRKAYRNGDDFWKIVGFENEKAGLMGVGVPEAQASSEAALRIRNTYPTYSMVGRGIKWLARFPLAGTFVSFPAEIIRTTGHMLRYLAQDYQDTQRRPLALRRAVGLAMVSGFAYALQAMTMAMMGMDDDEEEAVRQLAAPWQRNSNFLFTGRDEKGQLRYFDLSFLDPYNWFKRPITALLRDQPWEDKATGALHDMLSPFLGTDIAAGALFEVLANKKESGGPVYNEFADPVNQSVAIADHLRKALQPGFVGNLERTYRAANGDYTPSGKRYDLADEGMGWIGWRVTTLEPKTALYYRSFEFTDAKKAATSTLNKTLATPNDVSREAIASAKANAQRQLSAGFKDMSLIVDAAMKNGMTRPEVIRVLRTSGVALRDIPVLLSGREPKLMVSPQQIRNAAVKARAIYGPEKAREIQRRYREAAQMGAAP